MNAASRKLLESLLWRFTHPDFKGTTAEGVRTVLDFVTGVGTCTVAVARLTDRELVDKLPKKARDEYERRAPARRFEVRGVLAGAYRGRGKRGAWSNLEGRTLLSHVVEVDAEGHDLRVLCPSVALENLCDLAESEAPSCPKCRERQAGLLTPLSELSE